jgi:RNA polymerase sigma factor (sigma-70 family)
MSPLVVRRYRAERLLREQFEQLRARVLGGVAARLRSSGVQLDGGDLDACYSQAWQGLYAAVLDGRQVEDPAAWLALVTYRRAIDELRSRKAPACARLDRLEAAGKAPVGAGATAREPAAGERDIAAVLDDRAQLRQLFEALRARLSTREQQAATLCYLQGLSRAEAAERLGVSDARMRKLMEGRGAGKPGVAAKMGALVRAIGAGVWCEEQGSLMRGLAYGMLDPDGERHRLAVLHRDSCPACRAYVLSLRGLAAALPPAPLLLHWTLAAGSAGGAAVASGAGGACGAGSGASSVATAGTGGAVATSTGAGGAWPLGAVGGGTLSATGAAGVGAAGGGWWLAGPLGAKLAVGCLLALGVGAGCVALEGRSPAAPARVHRRHGHDGATARAAGVSRGETALGGARSGVDRSPSGQRLIVAPAPSLRAPVAAAAQAGREFGPEQAQAHSASASVGTARSAARSARAFTPTRSAAAEARSSSAGEHVAGAANASPARATTAAEREFAPG